MLKKSKLKYKTKKRVKRKRKHIKRKTYRYRYRNRMNNMKGGTQLEQTTIPELLPILHEYGTIYVGVGAKYTPDNYPIANNTGPYQLVPDFTLFFLPETTTLNSRVLIIIIDKFDETELALNIRKIESRIDEFNNIDYVIINSIYNKSINDQMIQLINTVNMDSQDIIIADFIYYFSPNEQDMANREYLDTLFNILLKSLTEKVNVKDAMYLPKTKNIYKWIGKIKPNLIVTFPFYDLISGKLITEREKDPYYSKTLQTLINKYSISIITDF